MDRRRFVGLGLVGGVAALLDPPRAQDRTDADASGYPTSSIHRRHPLEFRLDSDYRPDLSDDAARVLVRAVRDFLDAEHPNGLTMSFWDLHPRNMPYLPRHLELVIDALFRGVADTLEVRPVDPIVVLALLYNESRFHPKVVSPAGAAGIAQFMPDTALEYGLTPIGRASAWARFRSVRASYRGARSAAIREFRVRHGGVAYSADAAIERALATGSLDVLDEYRAIAALPDPSRDALRDYVDGLEDDFSRYQFFWDGRKPLGELDGRVSYEAVTRAVRYLARAMNTYQGFASTAIAAYNAGPDAVRVDNSESILHRFGELPSYPETVRYVQRFLAVYSAIKYRVYRIAPD